VRKRIEIRGPEQKASAGWRFGPVKRPSPLSDKYCELVMPLSLTDVRKRVVPFALALSALAATTAAGGGVTSQQQRVIQVLSVTLTQDVDDKLPKGNSKGDVVTGRSRLRNAKKQFGKPTGAIVGSDRLRGVMESASVASVSVTAKLPGGSIRCVGKGYANRAPIVLRVVSATGAFARASGTCEASSPPPNRYGADAQNVYRLRIPR